MQPAVAALVTVRDEVEAGAGEEASAHLAQSRERKRSFLATYTSMRSFYQDRLGTNIAKTQK